MIINKQLIPDGHPNRPKTILESLKAIVFHYTANDSPSATDIANAKYFGRGYTFLNGKYFEVDGKTPFRYGSTQILADMDSVTIAIPATEIAWSVGDRNKLPWTEQYRGQQPLSRNIFGCRPNYQTISIEICNNDVIKDSLEDWDAACANAASWIVEYLKIKGLKVDVIGSLDLTQSITNLLPNTVLILRHYDITGKICPKPFVDDPEAWGRFVRDIAARVI